jgi:outer membrane protein assembly factor BamD (BamD/ComL family)
VSDALPAESALLDVARTALGRGDGANALAATDAHAKKFPRGALSEEREAIRIQALRMLHRDDEANAKLDRFRARFPTSLLRPALEAPEGGGDAGGR